MAVGKKYFNSTNLLNMTVALSLLRPDLQGFLGQNTTPPMPVISYPHNYSGVAFAPSSTSNFNYNFHLGSKEAVAQDRNPLGEFLDWHTTSQNQLDTDAVAMLFNGESHAPRETRTFSTELDSGYCSDGGRSPSALSSVSGSPPHDIESSCGNFQASETLDNVGASAASGFSLADQDILKGFELEDYIDFSIYDEPPHKKTFTAEQQQPFYPIVKTEPLSPVDTYTRKGPNSPLDTSYVPTDFNQKDPFEEISLEEPFSIDGFDQLDPYSIDFISTNEEFQEVGAEGDTGFDFESFANNLDYSNDLPPDIFDRRPVIEAAIESKHDSLVPLGQEPIPVFSEVTATRNDSGGPFKELLPLTQSYSGDWESAPLPLLSSVTVKQEKPDFQDQSASAPLRFTPAKVPREAYKDARPKIASSSAASRAATENEIVDMNISEFNSFLETLSEAEAQKARDIRRRGKNKVAARLCRKRKIELVSDIEDDIDSLKQKKEEILKERKKLQEEHSYYHSKISELQDNLFKSLRDESGKPLSAKEYSLFQGANGSVYVGKNIDSESRKAQSGGGE